MKFTFRIANSSAVEKKLTGLTIKDMALDKEYYLPRNAKYESENIEGKEYLTIKSFDVPSFVREYDYNEDLEITLPAMKEGDTPILTELCLLFTGGKTRREVFRGYHGERSLSRRGTR